MSEPDSGSDLASVQTRATAVDAGWQVTGRKLWTSHAHKAQYFIVLCRTSPRAESDRHAGLTQLIVDLSAPGVTIRPVLSMSGRHHFNEVVLDEVNVPEEMLVGRVGDGWRQVTSELAFERSGPERFLSNLQLLVHLLAWIPHSRTADLASVGSIVSRLLFVRRLSISVAHAIQEERESLVESALVKVLGTRIEQDTVEAVRLALGDTRTAEPSPGLTSALRDAILTSPGFTLRGGTTEILKTVIANGLSG